MGVTHHQWIWSLAIQCMQSMDAILIIQNAKNEALEIVENWIEYWAIH